MKKSPVAGRVQRDDETWKRIAKIALVVAAVALVYLPCWRAGFVWDDEQLVSRNPLLLTPAGLAEIWTGSRTADYFPLTNTVFWIEYHLFGQNALGYHLFNIVLQAANALLVWIVLRQLKVPGAWLAGLFFGIHPIHVESVAWISELKNVLSMFFLLLSAFFFFRAERRRPADAVYFASLIFFLLALLAKTQAVFLPVALILCLWWRSRGSSDPNFRRQAVSTWPFFAIAVVLSLVTIWFQNRGIGEETIVIGSFPRRLANAAMAVWWYGAKIFAPAHLMAIYPPWRFDRPDLIEWLPLVALVVVIAVIWWRGDRGSFVALACFIAALLPALGFVRMAYLRSGTLVADHLQYFADLPLIAWFSSAVALVWVRARGGAKIIFAAMAAVLLVVTGLYASARAAVFCGEETLWQDNLSKNPAAWQAHVRLGQRLFDKEQYLAALPHLEQAVELRPDLPDNRNLLGLDYCRLERFDEGMVQYRAALELEETRASPAATHAVATVRTNLANALAATANNLSGSASTIPTEAMQRYQEAIAEYEKAIEAEPAQAATHRNLGMVLARVGRYDEAERHLRTTLELVPNEPIARVALEEIAAKRQQ